MAANVFTIVPTDHLRVVTERPSGGDKHRLHLGCGNGRMEGWTNCDLSPSPATDLLFDVQEPWPVKAGSVEAVYSSHMLEHLPRPMDFFKHAWTAMEDGGQMFLRLPYGAHHAAWWDPTHLRPWFAESFCVLQPGYNTASNNLQHDTMTHHFIVEQVYLRLSQRVLPLVNRRWKRWLVLPWADMLLDNQVEELWVWLTACKSEEHKALFLARRHPMICPVQYVMYQHHFERREKPEAPGVHLTPLAGCDVMAALHQWR